MSGKHAATALIVLFPAVASANPIIYPEDVRRTPAGEIRVIAPASAVECYKNRWYAKQGEQKSDAQAEAVDDWPGRRTRCGWDKSCKAAVETRENARFLSEQLLFTVSGAEMMVEAQYTIEAWKERTITLGFPFGECMVGARLDSLSCVGPDWTRHTLEASVQGKCWGCTLPKLGSGQYRVNLVYQQPLADGLGVYILTSGATWRQPIESMWIRVRVPRAGRAMFNMPMEPTRIDSAFAEYAFAAASVRPKRDLAIQWEPFEEAMGSLTGRVVTEKGAPVRHANVIVAWRRRGTETGVDGEFVLHNMPAGVHDIKVLHVSAGKISAEVLVTPNTETRVVVTLFEAPTVHENTVR